LSWVDKNKLSLFIEKRARKELLSSSRASSWFLVPAGSIQQASLDPGISTSPCDRHVNWEAALKEKGMRFREHPKIAWPPSWSEWGDRSLSGEEGVLRDVDLIEPRKLLLSNEVDGKVYFAEIACPNTTFASRLHEKIKPIVGRPIREVGELELDS
jgi:hypothetical protein